MVPKPGPRVQVNIYRPISVLTSIYKVIAKTLANRTQKHLPHWIRITHTRFVRDRQILDNVFLAYEAMEWATENKQDLVILLLDFEKAYDRVNWTFLQSAMKKQGFSGTWIKWTTTLYEGAHTSVLVNGQPGEEFEMERGIRQGCPLAPYLYLFVADVLGHMINDAIHGVEGLTIPDGTILQEALFADDTNLYLKGSALNLECASRVLERFCTASGAKINWDKSATI
jgi:hypothetical protein